VCVVWGWVVVCVCGVVVWWCGGVWGGEMTMG
jgi:hypothetical protein